MRLAHGLKYSRRRLCISAYFHGQLIYRGVARELLHSTQARGAWRQKVAENLIGLGVHLADALDLACAPILNAPQTKY